MASAGAVFVRYEVMASYPKPVLRFPYRQLVGEEYLRVLMLVRLATPYYSSNNQQSSTDRYRIGNTRYDVIYGYTDDPIIEEVFDQNP